MVYAIWTICHTARGYGLDPDGMLQRNRLITAADTSRLKRWVGTLELVALRLLRGRPPRYAVYYYAAYIVDHGYGWWDNSAFFVELMDQAVADPEIGDSIKTIVQALGKLGPRARTALPALRLAEQREYAWYTPTERCTEEVRTHIRNAIEAIEQADLPR